MREQFEAALKDATLKQDRRRMATLRLIIAAVKDREIAARTAGRDPLGEADMLEILDKMVKQRLESSRLYEEGGRADLAEQERKEIEIIREFLPKQLNEAEMRSACVEAIRETGSQGLRDMGKCMASLKARYAGRMDFGKASQLVKEQLS